MKLTKPLFLPRRRCSSSRGHMILTLPIGPNLRTQRGMPCYRLAGNQEQRQHGSPLQAGHC